jgi:hypothetical protein
MRTIAAVAAFAAGCAAGSNVTSTVAQEKVGEETVWTYAVRNGHDKTLKLSALEWTDERGEFKPVGGMAEIAHCCREGTTTIPPGDTITFERKQKARAKLRLTYVLDGSDAKCTLVID